MNNPGFILESLIAIILIVFVGIAYKLAVNKHVFGRHFPIIDMVKRLFIKDKREKAFRELLILIGFLIVLWFGVRIFTEISHLMAG